MRLMVPFLFALAGLAQSPQDLLQKAPPQIDAALRARVSAFYQAHVDGKWRLADQYVAEDSKDQFFAMAKQQYEGFEILKISYSDDFTKAEVVVMVRNEWFLRGMKVPTSTPVSTYWKVVNGEWFWYVDTRKGVQTPFGTMSPGPGAPSSGLPIPPGKPANIGVAATAILHSVGADRTEVKLSAKQGSVEQVVISNGMPGHVRLHVEMDGTGVKAALDKEDLGANEKARLSLERDPAAAGSGVVTVKVIVEPTNQVVPIRVNLESSQAAAQAK